MRERRLLLHRREIAKLDSKALQRGYSIVPLSIYLKKGRIKIELGVGRGKRHYEKRETLKETEAKREIDRAMSRRR
jgi:SsrA-binding protein